MDKHYDVGLEPRVEKELDKIPHEFFAKIDKAILDLSKNPRPFGVKKIDDNTHRIRINDWRIIYAIFDKESRVIILSVRRRNEKTYK